MHLAIDASNIRQGGGVTHLSQLLRVVNPLEAGIVRVTVWTCAATAAQLPDAPWLTKLSPSWTEAGLFRRVLGQQFILGREMARCSCDVLFSPGGTLPFRFEVPVITMSQNMLPFEPEEAVRFGRWSWMRLKMWLLRHSQIRSFRKADGLIFLTRYARVGVSRWLGRTKALQAVIPHGVESRFAGDPKPQLNAQDYSPEQPFTFLYVSNLMPYKHQIEVAHAAIELHQAGWPIRVRFVGTDWGAYGQKFREFLLQMDPKEEFLIWPGDMPFSALHTEYQAAEAFLFASSCENLPNILIESMTAGLPIASSKCGPMPEVLGDAGIYFDPSKASEIAEAMRRLVEDSDLRGRLAARAKASSLAYSWHQCARATFKFLALVVAQREGRLSSSKVSKNV